MCCVSFYRLDPAVLALPEQSWAASHTKLHHVLYTFRSTIS